MDRNDRALTGFTMIGHAMFHTYELVIPIFVVIWLDAFSTTAAVLGVVVGVSYALTGIGALPSGVLADQVSAKWLIVGCMIGMGGGFLILSVASSFEVLAIGLFVWGVAASVYHPAGLTLLSRGAKLRGSAFAYHGAAGNAGVATGPFLGAVLLMFFQWRVVAALLVVPVVVAVVVALRLDFDEMAGSRSRKTDTTGIGETRMSVREFVGNTKVLFLSAFLVVFIIGNLYGVFYRGAFTFLPEILADIPALQPVVVGERLFEPSQYVYSGVLLLGGVGQFVGGKIVDRVSVELALAGVLGGLIVAAVGFVPAVNHSVVALLVVAGLLGFLVFMFAPINQELLSKYVPASVRGVSFGYTYVAIFGVGAIGAALAGVVLTRWTPLVLFGILAGLVGVAMVLVLGLWWHDRRGAR